MSHRSGKAIPVTLSVFVKNMYLGTTLFTEAVSLWSGAAILGQNLKELSGFEAFSVWVTWGNLDYYMCILLYIQNIYRSSYSLNRYIFPF